MIVSAHCPTTSTSSEEGCIPSSYILYAVGIITFVFLVIGALAYRQHAKNNSAKGHGLETQSGISRPDLERADSAKPEISLPVSNHTVDERQKVAVPDIAIVPEVKRPSTALSPAATWRPAEEQPAVNFSRRTLLLY